MGIKFLKTRKSLIRACVPLMIVKQLHWSPINVSNCNPVKLHILTLCCKQSLPPTVWLSMQNFVAIGQISGSLVGPTIGSNGVAEAIKCLASLAGHKARLGGLC